MGWGDKDLIRNIDRIAVGIAVTRPDGTVQYANRHLREMLGVGADTPVDLSLARLKTAMGLGAEAENRQRPDVSEERGGEACIESGRGESLDILYAVYPLRDHAGAITHHAHLLQHPRDVRSREKLVRLAFYDVLTGLPNRNLFNDRMAQMLALAQRNRTAFALLYIDIDHFKRVNDTCGHETGDELLREVAARLAKSIRASDTMARWGGDEFIALLDGVADQESAARIAAKMLAACGEPYVVGGHECRITLSVGASFYPRDGTDASTLLRRADGAMYEVKADGRNGYRVEEPACLYPVSLV